MRYGKIYHNGKYHYKIYHNGKYHTTIVKNCPIRESYERITGQVIQFRNVESKTIAEESHVDNLYTEYKYANSTNNDFFVSAYLGENENLYGKINFDVYSDGKFKHNSFLFTYVDEYAVAYEHPPSQSIRVLHSINDGENAYFIIERQYVNYIPKDMIVDGYKYISVSIERDERYILKIDKTAYVTLELEEYEQSIYFNGNPGKRIISHSKNMYIPDEILYYIDGKLFFKSHITRKNEQGGNTIISNLNYVYLENGSCVDVTNKLNYGDRIDLKTYIKVNRRLYFGYNSGDTHMICYTTNGYTIYSYVNLGFFVWPIAYYEYEGQKYLGISNNAILNLDTKETVISKFFDNSSSGGNVKVSKYKDTYYYIWQSVTNYSYVKDGYYEIHIVKTKDFKTINTQKSLIPHNIIANPTNVKCNFFTLSISDNGIADLLFTVKQNNTVKIYVMRHWIGDLLCKSRLYWSKYRDADGYFVCI